MSKLIKSELFRIKNSNILLSSIIIIFIITYSFSAPSNFKK